MTWAEDAMPPLDPIDDLKRLDPFLADIRQACQETGEDLALICGIILRESAASWGRPYSPKGSPLGWGDGRHGFSIFQVDRRFHQLAMRGLVPGVDLTTVLGLTRYVCHMIGGARRFLKARHPDIAPDLLERATLDAYNADLFDVDEQLDCGRDPDAVTTPGPTGHPDYGTDVQARAQQLRRRDQNLFPPPAG